MSSDSSQVNGAIATLRAFGMANPQRVVGLILKTIDNLELDLAGITILTEAASGSYVVTPVIAALAGAKRVIAITRDSHYATALEVTKQTQALETLCGLEHRVEIYTNRSLEFYAAADIVTNLGFVRPLDQALISAMSPGAVISLMCEAWELRASDIDLKACKKRGIQVFGTNEDFPGLEVFDYSGWLCVKLLLDAGIEIHKSRIFVISSDKFGDVIVRLLRSAGISVTLKSKLTIDLLKEADAVVIADYCRSDEIIGKSGDLSPADVARAAPWLTIVQFAGCIDVAALAEFGITVYPQQKLPSHRMARTLSEVGPRPVIELHAAGLKVGALAIKNVKQSDRFKGLAQTLE